MQPYNVSALVVRGVAKKHKDQQTLIMGGLAGEDAGVTQRQQDGRDKTQVKAAESGNGKLDNQFFFSIHFDLRDCTVSVRCYLGHLLNV